ncbi:MAG TPA: hypothetical protein VK835_00695, partial [Bacteroidia bacterium]|nr:hypothetical protein [Bacteroidia bacterium]
MKLNSAGYFVCFEESNFSHFKQFLKECSFSNVFILCDKNTQKHCLPLFLKENTGLKGTNIFSISAGEKYKTLDTAL